MTTTATSNRSSGPPHVSDEALFRRYAAGHLDARDALVERHMPMAERLVGRYARTGEAREDLVQSAYVGLLKAIDRYEPGAGSFISYAIANIVGEVKRHFRDKGWGLHVARPVQERYLIVERAIEAVTTAQGRSATPREIAQTTGLTVEQVLEALEAGQAYSVTHLEAPASSSGEAAGTLGDVVGATDAGFGLAELRADLAPAFRSLPEREQQILYLRFVDDLNQREIAALVGVSQMHVSRLIRRAIGRLEAQLAPEDERLSA